MQKRTLKVAILAALTIVLVFSMSAAAFAQPSQYSDLNGATVGPYKVTLEQVSAIADVESGMFRPYADITRAEFAVMAVKAFDIPLVNPATPSFPDVPATHALYQYIEAAAKAGIILGYTDGKFGPADTATRQQMLSMIARYVGGKAGYYAAGVWNFRTPAEIDALVAHFGDAASIDPAHKTAMAFSYAMGITLGNAQGNLAPLSKTMRLQAAAMLIRSTELVPFNAVYPANVVQVSADKSENLIGQTHTLKFKVTDAAGHPAKGALVDFDTMYANPFYVGNISPQAALTDAFGEVTVNLLSAEPGTQRVTATVQTITGPATAMATKYWVALDEVYIMADSPRWAENNAGDAHEWCARVVVVGPGPRSTSQFDWYNAIDASFDPANLHPDDGRWFNINSFDSEPPTPYVPRTMAGIGVEWSIIPFSDTVASVGDITEVDGAAITPAKKAMGMTDADGLSCITIYSEAIGDTKVQAIATYPENPYPQMLLDRDAADPEDWNASEDWEYQYSKTVNVATKHWLAHVIPDDSDAPITPAYAVNNTGEEEEFVLELKDVFGNPIEDYQVEWWIQGVGLMKYDGTTWVGTGEQNKDIDETDAAGKASVLIKSDVPGQTIVHCKVMDKYGLPWKEWNVVKQWYAVDLVTMDNPLTPLVDESVATNPVGTSHTFNVWALGWKYVYVLTDANHNGLRDDAVLLGDRADIKAKSGAVLNFDGVTVAYTKPVGDVLPAGRVINIAGTLYTNYTDASDMPETIVWVDSKGDGVKEAWHPLQGKGVNFFTNVGRGSTPISDAAQETIVPGNNLKPEFVGSITGAAAPYAERYYGGVLYDYDAVTDAGGKASVTIYSEQKGSQYVYAVVDYPENPQSGNAALPTKWAELNYASALKTWTPGAGVTYKVFSAGLEDGNVFTNPVLDYTLDDGYGDYRGTDADNPNLHVIAVQVFDAYGNAVEGWKVDFQIVDQGKVETTGNVDTYRPYTHFAEWGLDDAYQWVTPNWTDKGVYDLHPFVDANPLWDAAMGTDNKPTTGTAHWYSDDDYSWGETRNGYINFEKTLDAAAYTTLVLDETSFGAYTHIASKVNVKIYNTADVLVDAFQVTKEWSLEDPELTSVLLEQWDESVSAYITGPVTTFAEQDYRATLLDQFGNAFAPLPTGSKLYFDSDAPGKDFVATGAASLTQALDPGVYTVTFWVDKDGDNIIDAGELKSNSVVTTILATTTTSIGD